MKQETYYVVVNSAGEYLTYTYDGEHEYKNNLDAAVGFSCDNDDLAFAQYLAARYNGTVKEVTITIKD